ncbi:hypothetical protein M1413_03040 [Patescibacteria group bacterium]|jgi:hypothetical protein|nr:hypothetical protein [Patescibacteria group bacterium]MCL5114169.1 hypothetical protein [Patescibacteria group bacterium]
MDPLEFLKSRVKEGSEEQLNNVIAKGVLKLGDEQIATVAFVFWLVYMAETELNAATSQSWAIVEKFAPQGVKEMVADRVQKLAGGRKKLDLKNLEYFSDKIRVYEALLGDNKLKRLLWKLNDIRNDLSHNRVSNLSYDGESLSLRSTKEKILIDYFDAVLNSDVTTSDTWNSLSEDNKKVVKSIAREVKKQGLS